MSFSRGTGQQGIKIMWLQNRLLHISVPPQMKFVSSAVAREQVCLPYKLTGIFRTNTPATQQHITAQINSRACAKLNRRNTIITLKHLCNYLGDIASLCINLSLKTVQFSPPIFGKFFEKLIFCFFPLNNQDYQFLQNIW